LTQWECVAVGIPITSSVASHRIARIASPIGGTTDLPDCDRFTLHIVPKYNCKPWFLLSLCAGDVSGPRTVRRRLLLNNRLRPSGRRATGDRHLCDNYIIVKSLHGHRRKQRSRSRTQTVTMVPVSVVAGGCLVVCGTSSGSGRIHAAWQRGTSSPKSAQVSQDTATPPKRRRCWEQWTEKAEHRTGSNRRSRCGIRWVPFSYL